jgi:hypothetical protein
LNYGASLKVRAQRRTMAHNGVLVDEEVLQPRIASRFVSTGHLCRRQSALHGFSNRKPLDNVPTTPSRTHSLPSNMACVTTASRAWRRRRRIRCREDVVFPTTTCIIMTEVSRSVRSRSGSQQSRSVRSDAVSRSPEHPEVPEVGKCVVKFIENLGKCLLTT